LSEVLLTVPESSPLISDLRLSLEHFGPEIVSIHLGDHVQPDLLRTHRLAFSDVSTTTKHLLTKLGHHVERALVLFGSTLGEKIQMAELRPREQ
jgi:hypothetical protein